jgi:hypothetical protein
MTETMDCLTFRRYLNEDPAHWRNGMVEHARTCNACDSAVHASAAFEATLKASLDGPVPGGLEARILLEVAELQECDDADGPITTRGRGRTAPIWLGLAASISVLALVTVFVVSLSGSELGRDPRAVSTLANNVSEPSAGTETQSLDHAIVQIIRDEFLMLTTTGNVGDAELDTTLGVIGLSLRAPLDNVRFATNCVIRGRTAAHWILQGTRAPITVFVMPNEPLARITPIIAGSMHGLLVPVAGGGSIAVVGAKGERLHEVGERVAAVVNWSA